MNASWPLRRAAELLRSGAVVLHATEGVWGLACDPMNMRAVARVLSIKERSPSKGLIVIGDCAERFADELSALAEAERAVVAQSWPGPNTWLVPNQRFPGWITGGSNRVAVRVPGHAQARALCVAFDGALVSTSANRSGLPSPVNAWSARRAMAAAVDYVLAGETLGNRQPSTIRVADGTVVRPGAGR